MKKEKIYELILFVLIFVVILSKILLNPLNELDELWNYNFARNIAEGLVPYKDFNMIVTPLLSIICGIILKITFYELIVMRVLAAIVCSAIFYITYKIFNILNVKKEISLLLTFFTGYLFYDIYGMDYNYLSLLLSLVLIYLEIKFYKKDYKFIKANFREDIWLGIFAGLVLTTKQTIGGLICIVLLGNKLLFIRKSEEYKIYFKSFLYRLLGLLIPVSILFIYLILNNAFMDFIDYTILGILEFTNQLPYTYLFNWDLIGILSVIVPITFVFLWVKYVLIKEKKEEYFLLFYGIATFSICFPISNKIHFLIGALPIIIVMLREIYNLIVLIKSKIFKKNKLNKIVLKTLKYMIILFLICCSGLNLHKYINMRNEYSKFKHFSFIPVDSNFQSKMENVITFLEENENVKILDWMAAIFTIPTDKYNKNYDMFNKGNFGYKGESKIIEEISKAEQTKYLILKEKFNENWQIPYDIIEFVKNTKIKIGEIEMFSIYK